MRAPAGTRAEDVDPADAAAFTEFYERSYSVIVGQVFLVTTNRSMAEEATQEAFLRLWPRWSRISRYEKPEAWVRRVALHVAMKHWRRARRGEELAENAFEATGLVSEAATTRERLDLIAGLRRLPASHRQAILLHYVVGLSVQEIAEELSTSLAPVRPGTVKSWLHRGRAELGKAFSTEEIEDG